MYLKTIFLTFLLVITSFSAYGDSTQYQKVSRIQYNGNSQKLFFVGENKWVSQNCPSATYIQVKSDVPGIKEIMSIGLAAKMAAKKVSFWGSCDSDPTYFNAHYIILE